MLKNIDKIIDTVYLILLCIIISALNLFIGSNHQEPKLFLEITILLVGISFLIIKTIRKEKNLIIKGKIDILVLLFIFVTFIPLLNGNRYSVNDTINFSLIYVCVYVIYVLARNLLKTKKEINIVIDSLLISSVLIIIFGLDRLYFNVFKDFLRLIQSRNSTAYFMISTFGYSNPLVAYMSLLSFFALGRYLCVENKWIKALFSGYIQIAMIGFVFGNSRALMIMYPIIFILYLITLKDNQKRLLSIAIIGGNIAIAYIFQAICNKFITTNFQLWLAFGLDIILVYILSLIVNKGINRIRINKKILLIALVIITIIISIYILAVKDIGEPIVVENGDDYIELLGLKNNEQYNIKINVSFDLKDTELKDIEKNKQPILQIAHYSSKRNKITLGQNVLQNGEQILEFDLQAKDDFDRFRIYIKNLDNKQHNVVVNHIYINNKEYIVKYKYLPNDIIRMVRSLSFRTVSVYERIAFYEDSLKLAKNHLIFGAGGNVFANHIKPYQSYVHGYNGESHSYIIDLLLDYGIIGLLTYVSIVVLTIFNARKIIINARKENNKHLPLYLASLFGLLLFTLHAAIDYDMNYLVTISVYYMFIAILNNDNKAEQEIKSTVFSKGIVFNLIIITALISCLTITLQRCYADYLVKQKEYEKAYSYCKHYEKIKYTIIKEARKTNDIDKLGNFIELYIKDEKFKNNVTICDNLNYIISSYLTKQDYEKALKYTEILYKYMTENDNFSKVSSNEINSKKRIINETLGIIENYSKENKQILELYEKFEEIH